MEAARYELCISVILHSNYILLNLHLELELHNGMMSGKIHAGNLNLYFFLLARSGK